MRRSDKAILTAVFLLFVLPATAATPAWVRQAAGYRSNGFGITTDHNNGLHIAADRSGIYVIGYYEGRAEFGGHRLPSAPGRCTSTATHRKRDTHWCFNFRKDHRNVNNTDLGKWYFTGRMTSTPILPATIPGFGGDDPGWVTENFGGDDPGW